MSKIRNFLRVLNKFGYPNDNTIFLAESSNYDIDDFLPNLMDELGEEGVISFCQNAINKISTSEGIRIEFGKNEYIYSIVNVIGYDDEEYSEQDVAVKIKFTDAKIWHEDDEGVGSYVTMDHLLHTYFDNYYSLESELEIFQSSLYNYIYKKCGFGIWVV